MKKIAAAIAVAALGLGGASGIAQASPAPTRAVVGLPAPTGPHRIGTMSMELVNRSQPDPWTSGPRALMVSVWYPARDVAKYPLARQMQPGAAAGFDQSNTTSVPAGTVNWAATKTHAHVGAPAQRGAHPVVLYSPGVGDPRTWGTTLVEELASRGYVVVTIDHPGETFVQFPDGVRGPDALSQAPTSSDPQQWATFLHKVVTARETDTRFVLDQLVPLDSGRVPQLTGTMDLRRIGMFGQSGGGFTALQTMHDDGRIKAAIDMDGELNYAQEDLPGTPMSTVVTDGLSKPFMLMGSKTDGRHNRENTSWNLLWKHSTGWHRDLYLTGSAHGSYADAEAIVPQLLSKGVIDKKLAIEDVGTVDSTEAVAANRAYITAFFDQWLRGHKAGLLTHPTKKYPDMTFIK
jgi:predicted dienelactone hydrolase